MAAVVCALGGGWAGAAQAQTVVYDEDFSNLPTNTSFSGTADWNSHYTGDNWYITSQRYLAADSDNGGGTWGSGGAIDNHIVYEPSASYALDDSTLNLTIRSTDNDTIGVVFRYTDAQNFYLFFLQGGDRYPSTGNGGDSDAGGASGSSLYAVEQGWATLIGSSNVSYGGNWHKLRIEAVGTAIDVYFDRNRNGSFGGNDHIISVTDSTHAEGKFGAYCYDNGGGNGCLFDNFEVTVEDADGDGVLDSADNCPNTANPSQADQDGDGLGDACDGDVDGDGYDTTANGGDDCNDTDAAIHPGAAEVCGDGVDNDCDGQIDPSTSIDAGTWYRDGDQDGYGNGLMSINSCTHPSGYVADGTDCDDTRSDIYPGAPESCVDAEDLNCDGSTSYADLDNDGYAACVDCDDTDATAFPFNPELCDGVDNDCDGSVDEAGTTGESSWYEDSDGDGYGNAAIASVSCFAASGQVADHTDCNDGDSGSYPGAPEFCDGVDNDCDGIVDESDAVDATTWYQDADGDGYGGITVTTVACSPPNGYVAVAQATDCDDLDAAAHPGATETWYDGVDSDCNGASDYDADQDGEDSDAHGGVDCDDTDGTVNTDAADTWYDGVDSDCDGASDYDADGDGFDSAEHGGDDCDDARDDVYPGAPDTPYDGDITDCDSTSDYDADGDGFDSDVYGGNDCDDARSDVNPAALETWYDGIDQDCDGRDDDQDQDGYPVETDCDDTDPDVYPGSEGLDDDCNPLDSGVVDTVEPVDTDGPGDSDEPLDTGLPNLGTQPGDKIVAGGCACDAAGRKGPGLWLSLLLLPWMVRRREPKPVPIRCSSRRNRT
jgi:hypothetical protein